MADKAGSVRVEMGRKRVRVYLEGEVVADTIRPFLVWEWPYYPTYYIPAGDMHAKLVATGKTEHSPSRGEGKLYDIKVGAATAPAAAWPTPTRRSRPCGTWSAWTGTR